MSIKENKSRLNIRHDGRRYAIRLPDWAIDVINAQPGQPSQTVTTWVVSFAAANGVEGELDTIFRVLKARWGMNYSDTVFASVVYGWANLTK